MYNFEDKKEQKKSSITGDKEYLQSHTWVPWDCLELTQIIVKEMLHLLYLLMVGKYIEPNIPPGLTFLIFFFNFAFLFSFFTVMLSFPSLSPPTN